MGEELGSVYTAICDEVTLIHIKWDEYMTLFSKKPRVELLNKAAPGFFMLIQRVLFDDLVLSLARLTDPVETKISRSIKKDNLTVQRLPLLLGNPEKRSRLQILIDSVIKETAFCRDRRNRALAHKDLALSLEKDGVTPLEHVTTEKIAKALSALAEIVKYMCKEYFNSDFSFDKIIRNGGADHLIYTLHDGMLRDEEKKLRAKMGKSQISDRFPEDLC